MAILLSSRQEPIQNQLLAALPAEVFDRIFPHLERVALPLGKVIHESGGQLQHVYFPTTAMVSMHYIMENGASAEIASIGNEGMLGISLCLGGGGTGVGSNATPNRAAVYTGGHGYRLKERLIIDEFNRAGPMMRLMLRYTQTLIAQIAQTAVCNRHHSVEQQLCRWLLLTLDRLSGNELTMTQELIASMLGVRREGITEIAGKLQREGLISYRRGHITVLNRTGLEAHACECYQVVRKEFRHLFSNAENSNKRIMQHQTCSHTANRS